jgi:hypothetical protein
MAASDVNALFGAADSLGGMRSVHRLYFAEHFRQSRTRHLPLNDSERKIRREHSRLKGSEWYELDPHHSCIQNLLIGEKLQ